MLGLVFFGNIRLLIGMIRRGEHRFPRYLIFGRVLCFDGAYGVTAALEFVALPVRVRVPIGTPIVSIVRFYDTLKRWLQRKHWVSGV